MYAYVKLIELQYHVSEMMKWQNTSCLNVWCWEKVWIEKKYDDLQDRLCNIDEECETVPVYQTYKIQ